MIYLATIEFRLGENVMLYIRFLLFIAILPLYFSMLIGGQAENLHINIDYTYKQAIQAYLIFTPLLSTH